MKAILIMVLAFCVVLPKVKNDNNCIKIERDGYYGNSSYMWISTKKIKLHLSADEINQLKAEKPADMDLKDFINFQYRLVITDKQTYLQLLYFIDHADQYFRPETFIDGFFISIPGGQKYFLPFNNIHPFFHALRVYLRNNKCDLKLIDELPN
jgi:hypothetical protein